MSCASTSQEAAGLDPIPGRLKKNGIDSRVDLSSSSVSPVRASKKITIDSGFPTFRPGHIFRVALGEFRIPLLSSCHAVLGVSESFASEADFRNSRASEELTHVATDACVKQRILSPNRFTMFFFAPPGMRSATEAKEAIDWGFVSAPPFLQPSCNSLLEADGPQRHPVVLVSSRLESADVRAAARFAVGQSLLVSLGLHRPSSVLSFSSLALLPT